MPNGYFFFAIYAYLKFRIPNSEFRIILLALQGAALLHHFLHAGLGVQNDLTQTDGLGGHLDELIVVDVLDGLLQGEDAGGSQQELFVGAGGADGGHVLAFLGLFIGPKTAVVSCCYLVPMTLFFIYIAPFWFTVKKRWQAKRQAA